MLCVLLTVICCLLSGWLGILISTISFLFFTDMCIYWIHRFLHHKHVYKVGERMSTRTAPSPPQLLAKLLLAKLFSCFWASFCTNSTFGTLF